MNTITIDTNVYRVAELYAKLHNTNIKELAEKALMNIIGHKKQQFTLKTEDQLSPAIKSLIGIAKPSDDKEDINGRNIRE